MLNDIIRLVTYLNWKKLSNFFRLIFEYWYAKYSKKLVFSAMPFSISYEPTTSCNLKCPQCPSGLRSFTRETGMAEGEDFTKLIDEIGEQLMYLIFYFQGEPYLNKKLFSWINYAHQRKIYTATSTNAHYLNEENAEKTVLSGLDRIIISLDGASQESYEKYRIGGSFEKVILGIENLVKAKKKHQSKTPFIILQNIIFKHNEHEISEIKALGKKLGVDKVAFKTAQIYDYENGSNFIPEQKDFSRYKKNADGSYALKGTNENSCWKMWHSCVMTWDGKIVPCCFDKDAKHQLGDFKTNNFRNIWFSENYNNFRRTLLKSRKEIDICKNCSEGTKVWL